MNKKKIGILTQYYRRNYGGVLQSYALFHVLCNLGYDVEIIDFRYDAKSNYSISQYLSTIIKRIGSKKRSNSSKKTIRELPSEHVESFNSFKKAYLRYSPVLNNKTIGKYVTKYDAIIVGSDQVWNGLEGKHLFYFFDFGEKYLGKKVAYAPCSIITDIPFFAKRKLKRLFAEMDAISVRDETTKNLVSVTSGLSPEIVLDPTYLYSFSEFVSPPIVNEDYIFAYLLGSEIECGHRVVLKKIFEKYGKMKIVAAIIPNNSLEVEKFADEIKYNLSPDKWVNLIANAKLVYTDSFHGCVFSMKFHKPFFAYYRDSKRASRLLDLKNTYNLLSIHSPGEDISLSEENYERIDYVVEKNREKSTDYLKRSLSF